MIKTADFHIHSRYSRACSPALTFSGIEEACRQKGVDIVATGDFTYPAWFRATEEELEEVGSSGLFCLKERPESSVRFILSTELSLVYKDEGRARRIHLVVMAPNLEAARFLNASLGARFNIRSDGRPILGISAPDFVRLCLEIDERFIIFPAHIWTPWYAVFGSKSGFDTLEECFKDQVSHIHAYESGLSSDPEMNWRVSQLDNYLLLSNSDAHSLPNIGREANQLSFPSEEDVSFSSVWEIIRQKLVVREGSGALGLVRTIEFYPEEGMYHFDGHRACAFSCPPSESRRRKNICPVCGKPLVIGVLNRVEELADRGEGYRPEGAAPFVKLVELDKVIAQSLGLAGRNSKQVAKIYAQMVQEFGGELGILMNCDIAEIGKRFPEVAQSIDKVRRGELIITPGFDGQYGSVSLVRPADAQTSLF